MRLIDADGLKVMISQNGEDRDEIIHDIMEKHGLLYENNVDEDKVADFAKDILKAVCNVIETEPTAYDLHRAIERIKDRTSFLHGYEKQNGGKAYDTMMMYEVAQLVDDIIGILEDEENEN